MRIEVEKAAAKAIGAMDRPTKQRVHRAIMGLLENPPRGDIKALRGYQDRRMRLRVGKYRITYRYSEDGSVIYILKFDSRGDIYKD